MNPRGQHDCGASSVAPDSLGAASRAPVVLLQFFAVTLFVFPSNSVIRIVGANGYVAAIAGLVCLGVWFLNVILGAHNPFAIRNPTQLMLAIVWASTLTSYLMLSIKGTDPVRKMAADNNILALLAISGVALMTAEGLRSLDQVRAVVRALAWGASFSAAVGVIQYVLNLDLAAQIALAMPGFDLSGPSSAIGVRFGLTRVAGTALSPIEFGVVCGMILPLAIWLALSTRDAHRWTRWAPVVLLLGGVVVSVSRSSVVAVVVGLAVFTPMLPAKERLAMVVMAPVALTAVFVFVRGYFATMFEYIAGATSDPSVTTRTDDYAFVDEMILKEPIWGHGPGWYIFRNAVEITDNQYILTAINLGLIGVLALLVLLLGPGVVSLGTRRRTSDPDVRLLCAAVASACLAGTVCSATFDSLAFPMFAGVSALLAGLAGATWLLGRFPPTDDSAVAPKSIFVDPVAGDRLDQEV